MQDLINRVLEDGMWKVIENSTDELLINDEVYQQDRKDLADLEDRYEALDLLRHDRMIINDYIACMNTANNREKEMAYMAGIRDTLTFLSQSGLLKKTEK